MNAPIIKNIKQQQSLLEVVLFFPKEAIFFQGHFPNRPILPGFVQLHYAMKFSEKLLDNSPKLKAIKRLKFSKIIAPDIDVVLTLERSDNKISFKYHDGRNNSYSSGELINE